MAGNPLWTYSISAYDKPGVAAQLIRLQDEFGADVNLMLCACWLGQQGLQISSSQWQVLIKASAKWRAECILPLRSVRRFMGEYHRDSRFYQQLKVLELEAERYQQDMLYEALQNLSLAAGEGVNDPCIQRNLQSYCDCLPGVEWQDMSAGLADLLVATRAHAI